MPVFYLDTSALVKRYRTEPGTEVVEKLFAGAPPGEFFISFLSIIELTSAVLRLVKGGQLRERPAYEILARFRSDVRDLIPVWPLNDEVATDAVMAVVEHSLRAADAMHLATAQRISSVVSGTLVVMVSSDRELLTAAEATGLATLDPQARGSAARLRQLRHR